MADNKSIPVIPRKLWRRKDFVQRDPIGQAKLWNSVRQGNLTLTYQGHKTFVSDVNEARYLARLPTSDVPDKKAEWRHWRAIKAGKAAATKGAAKRGEVYPKPPEAPKGPKAPKHRVLA
jgi:hypothetical protein